MQLLGKEEIDYVIEGRYKGDQSGDGKTKEAPGQKQRAAIKPS